MGQDRKRELLRRRRMGRPAGRRKQERGIALIMVVTCIAILTAVAVDFQYNQAVDLQLAANSRDELRAEYMARSAVNLSRLLLKFQKQVDALPPINLGGIMSQLGGVGGQLAGQVAPALSAGGGGLNIRLWDIVPIDCAVFSMMVQASATNIDARDRTPEFGEEEGAPGELALKGGKAALQSFGDFEGCFHAAIQDEEQKINVNRLNGGAATGYPPMKQALLLFADPRFEFLFDKPDANGVKLTATEVLVALHDWIDERDTQATVNLTGTGDPFPDGFSDENRNYTSYQFPYRSKNARFDSLDELYQVDGVSDLFMAAFRDRLTVYPDINTPLNINTNDPIQQYVNIATVAANENDPKLRDPMIIQAILQQIQWFKMFQFTAMSATTFLNIVESNGIAIRPDIKASGSRANNWITDKSSTFTIKATGQAGKVEKTITAVVKADQGGLGKLMYFRQE